MKVLKRAAVGALALLMTVSATFTGSKSVKVYATSIAGSNADYANKERDTIRQGGSELVLIYGPDNIMVEAGKTYEVTQRFLLAPGARNYMNPVFIGTSEDKMVSFSKMEVKAYDQGIVSAGLQFTFKYAVEVNYTITVSELAKIGRLEYGITAYDSRPVGYDDGRNATYPDTGAFKIGLDVVTAASNPFFTLGSYPRVTGIAGERVDIPVLMTNAGDLDAYDVYFSLGGNSALIALDTPLKQKLPSAGKGETVGTAFSFLVDENAKSQTVTLPINVSCRDYSGASYSDSTYYVIVDILGKEEFTRASDFVVKNVKQSPEKPQGGETVTLTFDLENSGDSDFRNVKILLANVSSSGFEPVDSNPYILIGDLEARETRKMTLTYKCGKNISGGANPLTLNFKAVDKHGADIEGSTTVYVLDVVPSRSGDSNTVSKPKLMVTEFGTDKKEILAADKFEFKFKIKNTNDESVARNIKVKVTSQSFSVTAGSNTFFVSEILPGEEAEISINLKASSSLQTGAYPIDVAMDYEYDVEVKSDNGQGNSVSASDEILLQVSELLRAQCENINVGDWDTPGVGSVCPLSFEFYNMGRSTLNNVYVTVEGDFELATGNSHYIGNIGPGSPEFVECSVRPLVSGDATCILVIHMEDSNGDEVTKESTTTVYVSEGKIEGSVDFPGMDFPGTDFPGGNDDILPSDEKKPINKFAVISIVAGVLVIAGVVFVVIKKKKKTKKTDDEFDD